MLAGEDFVDETINFNLSSQGDMEYCFNVTTIDDSLYEGMEDFFVNLTTSFEFAVMPGYIRIQIIDGDSEC